MSVSQPLQLIPAVDLMGGVVVRAAGGRRDSYRPLDCVLCPGAGPREVLRALADLHPFRALYIADLDALEGQGDHRDLVVELARQWPGEIWLDAGALAPPPGVRPVIGSEAYADPDALARALHGHPEPVLSLDFREGALLGPAAILAMPDMWPQRIILMNLGRVGSGAGPDTVLLGELRPRAPERDYWLAGGVLDGADLVQAGQAGAAGVILSAALWDGRLRTDDLAPYA